MPDAPHSPTRVPGDVWRGTAWQVLGRVFGATCTLASLFLAKEALSEPDFGRLTFYLALFIWLDALVGMGTGQVAVQRTAAQPERIHGVLRAARGIRLASGAAGVALAAAIAWGARERDLLWIVVAALYPLTHTLELSATVFKNQIAWGAPVRIRAIASALSVTNVAVLHGLGIDRPAFYLIAIAAGSASANVLLHLAARKHLPARVAAEPEHGMLREALPLGIAAVCAQTYFYADNVFVRAYCGDAELGRYNIAVRAMSWTIMAAQYASLAALPWLRRRHVAGQLGSALAQLTTPLFAAAGLGAGLLWPWSAALLELFGPGFGAAGASLRWLLGATLAVYAGSMLLTALVALGRNVDMLWIAAAGVALNIGANFWAVPRFGIEGAGMTTCATECFVALAAAWTLVRHGVALGPAWRWLGGPAAFASAALGAETLRRVVT
jgi:O-antigen/teichoic acid export membrane protein